MCNQNIDIIKPLWNSLEIVKLIISGLTPLIVAYLAFRFNKLIKKYDKTQWTNQKVIEKRILIYDNIVPMLNDLFCFYCFIGNWKELTPPRIIEIKRKLDKDINIYSPLFKKDLLSKYNEFIQVCFTTFTGWGRDATINSLFLNRKECSENWDDKWNDCFTPSYIKSRENKDDLVKQDVKNIKSKYFALMDEFKDSLEIYKTGIFPNSDTPKVNFK